MRLLTISLLASASLLPAQPQPDAPRPQFDAASIRPDPGYGGSTLKGLIAGAYQIQEFQISGGPAWTGSDRFDVTAKPDFPAVSSDRRRLMMQSLLQDRFNIQLRREVKQASVYILTVDKGGLKMRRSLDQVSPSVDGPAAEGAGPNRGAVRIGLGSLIGNAAPMPLFVRLLSQRLEHIVIDKTNLTGRFDFQARWTPDVGETPLSPGDTPLPLPADNAATSVFTAIKEQLGLRLEPAKMPVDFFIIDHAEKPSPN